MTAADTELAHSLPPVRGRWRRIWRHRRLMHHNRLAAGVVAVNIVVLADGGWLGDLGTISSMMLANIAVATLIRQQYVINAIFLSATSAPVTWPLPVRALLGKVYHVFGGVHVGGMVSATGWFVVFAATATVRPVGAAVLVVTYLIAALLLAMIAFALPTLRARHHNRFELMHRLGGWSLLALFWLHSFLFSEAGPASFLVLLVVSVSVALPWLRLRRVPVRITSPSTHVALVRFDYGVTPFAGSSTTVSRSPLREWHSFANVPSPGAPGFRLTISRAGDWTGALIDDRPSHLWVKGIPTAGVGNIDRLFRRVVWVATGSGIGPCLPHLLSRETPSRLVWSTRDPRATYGDDLVDEILAVQPDPVIWDTTASGKPDLVALAYQAYREFDAEAVICISNKKTTWNIVEQLEMRGIPAYGAIWDS